MGGSLGSSLLINLLNYLIPQTKEIVIQPMTVKVHFPLKGVPFVGVIYRAIQLLDFTT